MSGTVRLIFAQGYQIDLTINQLESEQLLFGYYLDGKTYVKDSARYLGNGKYILRGSDKLNKGMYFLAEESSILFDLVIGEDQFFELQANKNDYASSMKVVGDLDNQLFFENAKFNLERRKEGAPYLEILSDSTSSVSEKNAAKEQVEAINGKVFDYQDKIIEDYPNSILGILFKSGKEVEIPAEYATDSSKEGRKNSFYYYRNHYWDLFDLSNPILFRLPNTLYTRKVDDYFERLISPNPDSVKLAVDRIAHLAKKEKAAYRYLIWYLTIKFQTSNVMGMDEVYVHIVDNYFLNGKMDFWANQQLKNNLKEKADQYRSSLVGMLAPNLVLQDINKQPKALHELPNKYTVVYFYDPDCSHCKKETPVLKDFFERTEYDLGVYTVSADTSFTNMNNYIEKMGLQQWTNTNGTRTYGIKYLDKYDAYTIPTIYLLNESKEIIAKKITASQLEEIISVYEKSSQKSTVDSN